MPFARNTKQRDAVRSAFEETDRPLSPEEVLEIAIRSVPGLGIATVYRNIKGLLEDGWLTTVALIGDVPRYEKSGKHHHHHFHCVTCNKVFELSGCPDGINRLVPKGFKVNSHHLVLDGTCKECNE
jgi:Fur family ferric uptake transcriptional regulator